MAKSETRTRKIKKDSKKSHLTEKETRKFIDKQLEDADWIKRYIKDEVNSIRTNFTEKD